MATNTPKYSFKKPDESDFYSIQDQNGNWDKAESTLVDLDAPTFEDYTGATQVPTPETALAAINSKSKLSLLFSNIKAFLKGAVTIGMIVNNCATDNPNLPVSAAQAKALMDAVTKLNSDKAWKFLTQAPDAKIHIPVEAKEVCYFCHTGHSGNIVYTGFLLGEMFSQVGQSGTAQLINGYNASSGKCYTSIIIATDRTMRITQDFIDDVNYLPQSYLTAYYR